MANISAEKHFCVAALSFSPIFLDCDFTLLSWTSHAAMSAEADFLLAASRFGSFASRLARIFLHLLGEIDGLPLVRLQERHELLLALVADGV